MNRSSRQEVWARRERGFTLSEVLVAAAVASVLITVVGALLVLVMRNYREQRERSSLQGELIAAHEDMTSFLTGAAAPLLPSVNEIVTATFVSGGVPRYSGGVPLWQSFVGYRREGTSLVRLGQSFTPSALCPALPPNLAISPITSRVTVARDLSGLTFTRTGNLVQALVTVRKGDSALEGRFTFLLEDGLL